MACLEFHTKLNAIGGNIVDMMQRAIEEVERHFVGLVIGNDADNFSGGAIALGHPLGCTGARLTATLLHEMQRRQTHYGMVTICIGGGMGAAGIFERV